MSSSTSTARQSMPPPPSSGTEFGTVGAQIQPEEPYFGISQTSEDGLNVDGVPTTSVPMPKELGGDELTAPSEKKAPRKKKNVEPPGPPGTPNNPVKKPRGRPKKVPKPDEPITFRVLSSGKNAETELTGMGGLASSFIKLGISEPERPTNPFVPSERMADIGSVKEEDTGTALKKKKSSKKPSGQLQTWKVTPITHTSVTLAGNSKLIPVTTASTSAQPICSERITLTPRIWTSDRAELVAAIPTLGPSKSINGISWTHTRTPMILLDDANKGSARNAEIAQLPIDSNEDTVFDLFLTRSLVPAGSSTKINSAPIFEPLLTTEPATATASARAPLTPPPQPSAVKRVRFVQYSEPQRSSNPPSPPQTPTPSASTLENGSQSVTTEVTGVQAGASGNQELEILGQYQHPPLDGTMVLDFGEAENLIYVAKRMGDPKEKLDQLLEEFGQSSHTLGARFGVVSSGRGVELAIEESTDISSGIEESAGTDIVMDVSKVNDKIVAEGVVVAKSYPLGASGSSHGGLDSNAMPSKINLISIRTGWTVLAEDIASPESPVHGEVTPYTTSGASSVAGFNPVEEASDDSGEEEDQLAEEDSATSPSKELGVINISPAEPESISMQATMPLRTNTHPKPIRRPLEMNDIQVEDPGTSKDLPPSASAGTTMFPDATSLPPQSAFASTKSGNLPCGCHKRWVYTGCKIHAAVQMAHPLFSQKPEQLGDVDSLMNDWEMMMASQGRPKRKAAVQTSMKIQDQVKRQTKKRKLKVNEESAGEQVKVEEAVAKGSSKFGSSVVGDADAEQQREDQPVVKVKVSKRGTKKRIVKEELQESTAVLPESSASVGEKSKKRGSQKRKRANEATSATATADATISFVSMQVSAADLPRKRRREEPFVEETLPASSAPEFISELSPRNNLHPEPVVATSIEPSSPDPRRSGGDPSISANLTTTTTTGIDTKETTASLPSLPSEIRALIDAFISGTPLVMFASRSRIRELFATSIQQPQFDLPDECGYACMGFFRILGLEEKSMQAIAAKNEKAATMTSVQWKFRVEWVQGGDTILKDSNSFNLSRPWWSLPQLLPLAPTESPGPPSPGHDRNEMETDPIEGTSHAFPTPSSSATLSNDTRNSDIDTPLLYLQLRPEYSIGDTLIASTYFSLVPENLLSEFNAFLSNDAFPSGWFCHICGKINFQAAMRHRKCNSVLCSKDGVPALSYAQDLADIRGPHSGSPCCLPFNDHSASVLATSMTWNNGMRTLSYYFDAKITGERKVWAKHVFTCNLAHLQNRASEMIGVIQREVEVRRPVGDPLNPFFTRKQELVSQPDGVVPKCLEVAGRFIAKRASSYAEVPEENMVVSRLDILAWITSGRRLNQDVIRAKNNPIAIMCLGSDVVVGLTPARVSSGPATKKKVSKKGKEPELLVHKMGGLGEIPKEEDITFPVLGSDDIDSQEGNPSGSKLPIGYSQPLAVVPPSDKLPEGTVTIAMVHGDVLVLFGEDFSYSLKRSGAGIFIFGFKAT